MAVKDGSTFERVPRNCIHGAIWRAALGGAASVSWYGPLSAATVATLRAGGWTVSVRGDVTIVLLKH